MTNVPAHIGIIMDGNGRWAKRLGLPRIYGHREGARRVRRIVRAANSRGIRFLTLYAFSAENWQRPSREISLLMKLLKIFAVRERLEMQRENVRFRAIGDLGRLPIEVQNELRRTTELTAEHSGLTLQLALSYGGRDEIIRAVQKLQAEGKEITETAMAESLDTAGQPEPDLIIRTSGELRTSNFLLWQAAYSELYFTDKYWPDFSEEDLDLALEAYQQRQRRYGALDTETTSLAESK